VGEMLRVALVDDEPLSLNYLSEILKNCPVVELCGCYRNGREAVAGLATAPVDLLFLDIQMPGMDGFEVVKRIQSDTMPLVVFATAYDKYAVQAFELYAVDYVLKPFEPSRIELAVSRALQRRQSGSQQLGGEVESSFPEPDDSSSKGAALRAIDSSRENANPGSAWGGLSADDIGRLPIKDGGQTLLLEYSSIDWVDAAGDYMCVHAGGETHILRSTMKELIGRLPPNFLRIHRSTIINADRIARVEGLPKGEAMLFTTSGSALKVSRKFKQAVRHLLS